MVRVQCISYFRFREAVLTTYNQYQTAGCRLGLEDGPLLNKSTQDSIQFRLRQVSSCLFECQVASRKNGRVTKCDNSYSWQFFIVRLKKRFVTVLDYNVCGFARAIRRNHVLQTAQCDYTSLVAVHISLVVVRLLYIGV